MPNAKYKIAFITGKRGGFDAMLPTLKAMREHDRLEPLVIACDQHNMPHMGNTIHHIIHEWGAELWITKSDVNEVNSPLGRMTSISNEMGEIADVLDQIEPDCILLIGDRAESVVAALVAHNMRVPIAHVQGGDMTGGVDERQRYAITELSDLHLVSNQTAADHLGAPARRNLHIVGDPHIDPITLSNYATEDELKEQGYPTDPAIIVLQHPDTLDDTEASEPQMRQTLDAVQTFDKMTKILIYPCSDQGHRGIVKVIRDAWGGDPRKGLTRVYQNIPQYYFLALLKRAACIVGNSSAGIIEAARFGVGAVNIGNRQRGRLRANNVQNAEHDVDDIRSAISFLTVPDLTRFIPSSIYGDGKAYTRIPQIILEFLDAHS